MNDIDALLAKQAGQSTSNTPSHGGEQVVVSGLPQDAEQSDPIAQLLQKRASDNNESRTKAESKVDPNAGAYPSIGNLGYGALKGLADLVQAPAQLGLNAIDYANRALPGGGSKTITKANTNFNNYLRNQEELYQLDTPGSIAAGIGRFASNMLPFALSGGAANPTFYAQMASKAERLAKLMAKGAGTSILTQPATNVATNQDGSNDFLGEKGSQALGGAIGAPIGQLAGKALGAVISPMGSIGGSLVKKAYDSGMIPSVGKIFGMKGTEASISKLPFARGMMDKAVERVDDQLNTAAYNRALNPIGTKADGSMSLGHDSVLNVSRKLGAAYDKVLPKVTFHADAPFLSKVDEIGKNLSDRKISADRVSRFNAIIDTELLPKLNNSMQMDGQKFKLSSRQIDQVGTAYLKADSVEDHELGKALKDVASSMREALRRNNPEYADELSRVDRGYSNFAIIREAAGKPSTDSGKFTTKQLANAIYKNDESRGRGKSAFGQAPMQDLVEMAKAAKPKIEGGAPSEPFSMNSILGAIPGVLASPMYTDFGSRAIAAALLKRPDSAPIMANYARTKAPSLGAILGGKVGQQFNNNQGD